MLVELLNTACEYGGATRELVCRFEVELRNDTMVTIVPFSSNRLQQAISMYRKYRDQLWSITDCDSILAMRQNGILEALTSDHHFEQAGFTALLRTG